MREPQVDTAASERNGNLPRNNCPRTPPSGCPRGPTRRSEVVSLPCGAPSWRSTSKEPCLWCRPRSSAVCSDRASVPPSVQAHLGAARVRAIGVDSTRRLERAPRCRATACRSPSRWAEGCSAGSLICTATRSTAERRSSPTRRAGLCGALRPRPESAVLLTESTKRGSRSSICFARSSEGGCAAVFGGAGVGQGSHDLRTRKEYKVCISLSGNRTPG